MSWITQGFVIAASLSVMGASAAIVYSLFKGRAVVERAEKQLLDLNAKTKAKRAELNRLVDAAANLIKEGPDEI